MESKACQPQLRDIIVFFKVPTVFLVVWKGFGSNWARGEVDMSMNSHQYSPPIFHLK